MTILKDPTRILRKRDDLPRIKEKETLQLLPNIKKQGTNYRVINNFFDEKHRQNIFCLGNAPTICELSERIFPHRAVWDKLLDTYMDIDKDTVGSTAFKHIQFEYHGIDDNYPLTLDMLDGEQFSEVM